MFHVLRLDDTGCGPTELSNEMNQCKQACGAVARSGDNENCFITGDTTKCQSEYG